MIPSISSYGDYVSSNYGTNTLRVDFSELTLYYSYRTIVAFHTYKDGLVVCENDWGTTTGKHLNWINPDHSDRLPRDKFLKRLGETLNRYGL